jgi:hypothetical protein
MEKGERKMEKGESKKENGKWKKGWIENDKLIYFFLSWGMFFFGAISRNQC